MDWYLLGEWNSTLPEVWDSVVEKVNEQSGVFGKFLFDNNNAAQINKKMMKPVLTKMLHESLSLIVPINYMLHVLVSNNKMNDSELLELGTRPGRSSRGSMNLCTHKA